MAKKGLDPKTFVEEAGFDILCPPPYEAVEPSYTRISCFYAHDVICMDDEIYECDHDEPNDHYEAFMATMDKFVHIFPYSNKGEQNLLARSIVIILRRRGGRFLVCDSSGEDLFEGGDPNAIRVVLSVLQKKVERLESRPAQRKAEWARVEERLARKRQKLARAAETADTSNHVVAGMLDSDCEDKKLAGTSEREDTSCHLTAGMLDGNDDEHSGSRYFWC
jgi:hypothetical protein